MRVPCGNWEHSPETLQIGHGLPEPTSNINKLKLNEVFGTNIHTFNLTLQNVSTFRALETDYWVMYFFLLHLFHSNFTNKLKMTKKEAGKQAMNGRAKVDEVWKGHLFSALSHLSKHHFSLRGPHPFSFHNTVIPQYLEGIVYRTRVDAKIHISLSPLYRMA